MQAVQFLATLFVIVSTVIGAAVVPYVVLFVVQRRSRVGCGHAVLFVTVGGLLGFGVSFSLRHQVEARLALPSIQDALDDQCGGGVVRADPAHFVAEPFFSWIGDEASCHYIEASREWECYCPSGG